MVVSNVGFDDQALVDEYTKNWAETISSMSAAFSCRCTSFSYTIETPWTVSFSDVLVTRARMLEARRNGVCAYTEFVKDVFGSPKCTGSVIQKYEGLVAAANKRNEARRLAMMRKHQSIEEKKLKRNMLRTQRLRMREARAVHQSQRRAMARDEKMCARWDPTVSKAAAIVKRLSQWQARIIREGLVPWSQLMICKGDEIVFSECQGQREDNIHRWYSSTKPITSVALMMLYEEGRFQLSDPVWKFLGDAWRRQNMRVYVEGSKDDVVTEECKTSITVRMLLAHTSGLSYGFDKEGVVNPVDALYERDRTAVMTGKTLADFVAGLAGAPLMFQPGTAWHYGLSTDCVGYLVEVISGIPFGDFLQQRIFLPLGMRDTGFVVPHEKAERFVDSFAYDPKSKGLVLATEVSDRDGAYTGGRAQSGGAGLVGTAADYMRFARMLANGGVLDGVRILSAKTIEFMATNMLPGNIDTSDFKPKKGAYSEIAGPGVGFGLGFSVVVDVARVGMNSSIGNFAWGGAASTYFWVDPTEDLVVVYATQVLERDDRVFPRNGMLMALVYGALDLKRGTLRRPPLAKL